MESEVRIVMDRMLEDPVIGSHSIETIITAVREIVEDDLKKYIDRCEERGEDPHHLVVACLESAVNHLGDARMAWYASTK